MAHEETAPSFIIKLNNARLATEKEASVREITVISKLNDPSKFMILFSDPAGEWVDSDDIALGTKVSISLGYKDDVTEVIKGEITGMTAEFSRVFGRTVLATGYDKIHRLGKVKTARSFLEKSYSDAIKEMIQDMEIQCDVCDLGSQRLFIMQKDQTVLAFIREVADKFDLTIRCEGEKVILEEFTATKNEDVTLEWNKTLIKFNPESNSMNVITDLDLYTYNGRKMEGYKSEKKHDETQSDDLKLVSEKFGDKKQYVISRDVLDQNDADKMALKMLKGNSRKFVHATGTACGEPLIIGGAVIKAKGIPKRWDRMYHVIYARHVLRPNKGYITEFNCELYTGKQSKFNQQQEASSSQDKERQESGEAAAMNKTPDNKTPQLKNLKWKDKDNKDITKAHVGDKVKMTAEVSDIDDGVTVNIKIYEKDDDGNNDYVTGVGARVKSGKVETEWDVTYMTDEDDSNSAEEKEEKGYTLPEYMFVMECPKHGIEDMESGVLEVNGWINYEFKFQDNKELMKNQDYTIYLDDGTTIDGTTDSDGKVNEENLKFGNYYIIFK